MRKLAVFGAVLMLVSAAGAQEEKKARFNPVDRIKEFLDPERMKQNIERGVDRIVQGAADRYKLDNGQQEQLRALLTEKGKEFAEKSAPILKELADDAAALQEKGPDATFGDLVKVLEKARPLMEGARKSFNEAGDTFRDKVLDENQRKLFEEDRAKGQEAFDRFQQRGFGQGGFGGQGARTFNGRGFEEQSWEQFLTRTIRTAKMTDEQQSKAKEMLESAKKAAADYRKAKEADYKKVAADLAELRKTPDAEKSKTVQKAGEELSAPIDGIGNKLKADILALLSDEQKAAVEKSASGKRGNRNN